MGLFLKALLLRLFFDTIIFMNKKQLQVLKKIFATPPPSTLTWKSVESLLLSLKADLTEGRGSRVQEYNHDEI